MKKFWIALIGLCCFFYACNKDTNSLNNSLSKENTVTTTTQAYTKINLEEKVHDFFSNRKAKIINSSIQKNSGGECDGYIAQAFDCYETEITEIIAVPPYCSLTEVSYLFRICTDAGFGQPFQFVVLNFIATPLPTLSQSGDLLGCDDFIEELNNLPLAERTELLEDFEYAASIKLEESLAQQWSEKLNIDCPDESLQANFYRDLCYRWVESTANENPIILPKKESCGEQCCLRETFYCLDHGELISTEPTFKAIGDCETDVRGCSNECGSR